MPLTLRLIFHTIRAAWLGVILMLSIWVLLVPASAHERDALGASVGEKRPAGLMVLRIARSMVHFAPDRAARLLSSMSKGEISPELAGMMLRDIANGPAANKAASDALIANQPQQNADPTGRQDSTAKFIKVD